MNAICTGFRTWVRGWALSTRIAALSVGLLLLVQSASFGAIRASIQDNARASIAGNLEVGERALQRLLQQNSSRLTEGARLLAADFGFRDAVTSGDAATIASALENHGERIGASVAALLDTSFNPQASSHGHIGGLQPVVAQLAGPGAGKDGLGAFALVDQRPTQFVMVPLKAPLTIGWVLMGFTLDQTLATDLRSITGLHLMLLSRAEPGQPWAAPTVSTLPAEIAAALRADMGAGLPAKLLHTDDEEYGARVTRLIAKPGHETVAVLMQSIDAALAPFVHLQLVLGLFTLLGLAAFGVGSLFTARRVTTPIRRLAAAAERLGQGDYHTPMADTQRRDEIGELAQRFEHMRVSIAGHQEEIVKLAYWDRLTGLPNRVQFRDAVHAAISRPAPEGRADAGREQLAVLMLDLDRFKHVNDVLGYRFGDLLLKAVTERLVHQVLREGDLVARLGGDEFALLLTGADVAAAQAVAERVAAAFDTPLTLEDHTVDLGAGIGIACWPQHAADADSLLGRAELAMYAAKQRTAGPVLYDPSIDSGSTQTLSLLTELRQAVECNELRMFLQPKINVADSCVIGAEALVRWQHPQRGLVPPGLFIPFAEQTGFVRQLTLWIFAEAARQWPLLSQGGHAALRISVNLSTRDLLDAELPAKLEAILQQNGCPAQAFCLEITESAIMDDPQRAEATLNRLSERGFKLSIDDFGTGYSSLAYLKRLPVDELKIDRSFVMGMAGDADDAKIVRSTIDLAHNLGLSVVAEGVETSAIWHQLAELECDEAQGYFMSKPLPVADFILWRERWVERSRDAAHSVSMALH